MDKRKIDLDKLYQERFQSFEMEPSSAASTSMLKKLKMAKTISILKWIVGGIIITITAVSLTLLNLDSDKTDNQEKPIKNEIDIRNNTKPTENTQNTTKTIIKNDIDDETLKLETSQNIDEKTPQNSKTSEKQSEKQIAYLKEELAEREPEQIIPEKTSEKSFSKVELVDKKNELVAQESGNPTSISFIKNRFLFLDMPETSIEIEKSNLKLKSPVQTKPKKAQKFRNKKHSSSNDPLIPNQNKKTDAFQGYFDVHFAPLMWQNNANMQLPDIDSSWNYSFNQNPKLSYEFGLSFQLKHQNFPLFLQLGIDYQILREKANFQLSRTFEDTELSYWTYDSIWEFREVLDTFYIIIEGNQFIIDSIFVQDTVLVNVDSLFNSVTAKEERSKKHLNSYRYLNIPLLLGYQFESTNKKWNFQLLAGPSISINLNNEGYYYNNTGGFEEYSGKVTPSMVWNFYAAANINYRWKKWQIFAQPEFQYQLNESELKHQIPRRKYQFYKLKFGIRYQIF